MSSSYLEQLRSTLSSVEVIEKTIVHCLFGRNQLPQHAVLLDHRINNLMQMGQKYAAEAILLIDGQDGWKRDEMDALQGLNRQEGDAWDNFYDRYREIKDYHRRISQGHTVPQVSTNKIENFFDQAFEAPFSEPYFSGEESNGKYLDLHANYQEFLNLKKLKESDEYKFGDYLWYIQNFDLFHEIPQNFKEKEGSKYRRYLENLLQYIKGFYERVNPLQDINRVVNSFEVDFDRQWKSGVVRGWERLSNEEIQNNQLYCHICTKLFQNENTYVHHFQGRRHKKLAKLNEKNINTDYNNQDRIENENNNNNKDYINNNNDNFNNIADDDQDEIIDITLKSRKKLSNLEFMITCYKENLTQIVNDTMNLVRKKQSRSYDEEGDMDGQDGQLDNDNADIKSESDSPVYNPKNLPLGWDGRPIPYWLYKLHGLGVEYKCEICGNTSYWGRKAFEDHFQGWRHSYGMRCLRIPNTLHFKEITKIQDAIGLYQKIQYELEKGKFRPDYDEEYEDNEGNLLNKKTFYDLKKQGIS